MKVTLQSSAPHIYSAGEWRSESNRSTFVLFRSPDGAVEVGLREWREGTSAFSVGRDTVCYFQSGSGFFRHDSGENIAVSPDTLVHFKQGWNGEAEISGTVQASFMSCDGAGAETTPVLRDVLVAAPLKDWGTIPTMLSGVSTTAGILLSREPNGRAESGLWTCTPGTWQCEVTADEYCHFLAGSCTYTHESGERIEIEPDTLAFFPQGWKGTCEVRQTMRKVYMIR